MMQRLWALLLLLFSVPYEASSQGKLIIVDLEVVGYDTVISSDLPEVEILDFKSQDEKNNYFILKRRVLKVYPYAVVAKNKLQEIKLALDTIPMRRKKKRYTRKVAKWLKEQYTDRLKDLTISEGKILVKLIYRETNSTSYKILKSYRGSFNALFWQIMAKIWDNNLKTGYDPINIREDMLIEYILIEDGNEEFSG
tara:strand:+ start:29 stop:616 length:588 start_codon:yes stop_codon:yes gene_type:complete